jgi:membrane protease YdiL (CAAX protease family)
VRLPTRDRIVAALPGWLSEKVPRDHWESDDAFRRRRQVVATTSVAGAGLLGASLSTRPNSGAFYGLTLGTAATWIVGGLVSGRLHLGRMRRGERLQRPIVTPVLTGVGAFGVFYGAALVCRYIPVLDRAIHSVLRYANQGSDPLVLVTTLANGAAEEVFFRGALYAAVGVRHAVVVSTVVYALTTVATGNVMLVFAAVVLGVVVGLQRRVSGGVLAPMITHVTWSMGMLLLLPPIMAAVV